MGIRIWIKVVRLQITQTLQVKNTDSNSVESIQMNGKTWTGREVRTLLNYPLPISRYRFETDRVGMSRNCMDMGTE